MQEVSVREASVADHPDIAALYESCGYSGGIGTNDTILVAVGTGSLAGVVRLCSESDAVVLRGMQVLPGLRRQGIGRNLLAKCAARLTDASCYCIPWAHLEQFYGSVGFERCEPSDAPRFLSERLSSCRQEGLDVILMRRLAPNDG